MTDCHIHAARKFHSGEAEWICFRRTRKSKLVRLWNTQPILLRTLLLFFQAVLFTPLGTIVGVIAGFLMHVEQFLLTGDWKHASWINWEGEHWEYRPEGDCPERWFPPILFDGIEQRVKDKDSK